jgi:hypothetical protein
LFIMRTDPCSKSILLCSAGDSHDECKRLYVSEGAQCAVAVLAVKPQQTPSLKIETGSVDAKRRFSFSSSRDHTGGPFFVLDTVVYGSS